MSKDNSSRRFRSVVTGLAVWATVFVVVLLSAQNLPAQESAAAIDAGARGPGAATDSGGGGAGLTGNALGSGAGTGRLPGIPNGELMTAPSTTLGAQGLNSVGSNAGPQTPAGTPASVSPAVQNANPAIGGALTQQFGIAPNKLENLRARPQGGALSADQLQELTVRFGAMNLGEGQLEAIAHSMDLNDDQLSQIRQALAAGKNRQRRPSQPQPQSLPATSSVTGAPSDAQASAIERKFRDLDNPSQAPSNPSLGELSQFGYALFSASVSTFAPVNDVPVSDDYVIGPGDHLHALMWGRINQMLELEVRRDGSVQLDQVGPVQVAGLTFGQAKKVIEGRLQQTNGVNVNVTMGQLRTIQVFVVGQVGQPGAYTVSALSRISNALQAAGGVKKVGSLRDIQLRRGNRVVRHFDLYALLMHGDASGDLRLEPADVIFVPVIGKVIAVAGDVKVPAIYELGQRPERLRDVLQMAGGVTAFGYAERLQVERVDHHQRMIILDTTVEKMRSRHFEIRDGDVIKVYAVLPDRTNSVTLNGNVHRPGDFQWYKGMRVSDLIKRGQGILPHTCFKYALIKRLEGAEKYTHLVPVDLGAALGGDRANPADLLLHRKDELDVFSEDQLRDLRRVTIQGEVRFPGDYPLSEHMTLRDLIYTAGGLKDDAYRAQAELARTRVVNGSQTSHVYMDVDLRPILAGDRSKDVPLRSNDQIFVRVANNWHLPWVVTIRGRVMRPGSYAVRPNERFDSVIQRCGGLLPDAFPEGIIFMRRSVKKLEEKRLEESRRQLSQELAQYSLSIPLISSDQSGSSTAAAGFAALQRLVTMADNEQADGRMVIHFSPSRGNFAQSSEDVTLEDGDLIDIPRQPSSVNVLGQVYNPTAIVAQSGMSVRDYLYKAGGPNRSSDISNVMVIKADGSLVTEQGIEAAGKGSIFPLLRLTSGGIMGMHLQAGDTIYVPENIQDIPTYIRLQHEKDITQIISQSATALAIVGILAANL